MNRKAKWAIGVNAVLAFLFLSSNLSIWDTFNAQHHIIGSMHFDAFQIQFTQNMVYTAGNWVDLNGVVSRFNLPFWLFFVAVAVNLFFVYKLSKTSKNK